jgi:hypothetical protein
MTCRWTLPALVVPAVACVAAARPAAADETAKGEAAIRARAAAVEATHNRHDATAFAGLTPDAAAAALGIAPATADRAWAFARAWLYRELAESP